MPRPRSYWLGLFGLALLFRLLSLVLIVHYNDTADSFWYRQLAENLAEHGVFSLSLAPPITPTWYRPPLFPALMALQLLLGANELALQLSQCVVGAATVVLLARTIDELAPKVVTMVALLAALSPAHAAYSGALVAETWTAFFLVAGFAAPVLIQRKWGCVLGGMSLALAALCRDVYLLVILGVAVALLVPFVRAWVRPPEERAWLAGATLALGAAVVLTPWTIRNYVQFGAVVPVSKGILGQALWIGTWETEDDWITQGGLRGPLPTAAYRSAAEKVAVEQALRLKDDPRDAAMRKLAAARYREEPLAAVGTWFRRYPHLWIGTRFESFPFRGDFLARGTWPWKVLKSALWGYNLLLVLLGFTGMIWALTSRHRLAWFSLLVGYNALVFLPLHSAEIRYSQPALLFLTTFAALAINRLHNLIRSGSSGDNHHLEGDPTLSTKEASTT